MSSPRGECPIVFAPSATNVAPITNSVAATCSPAYKPMKWVHPCSLCFAIGNCSALTVPRSRKLASSLMLAGASLARSYRSAARGLANGARLDLGGLQPEGVEPRRASIQIFRTGDAEVGVLSPGCAAPPSVSTRSDGLRRATGQKRWNEEGSGAVALN